MCNMYQGVLIVMRTADVTWLVDGEHLHSDLSTIFGPSTVVHLLNCAAQPGKGQREDMVTQIKYYKISIQNVYKTQEKIVYSHSPKFQHY